MMEGGDRAARYAEILLAIEAELDWGRLGALYCHDGGESFFPAAQVESIRDAGLHFAADVAAALASLGDGASPRSLYFGAALAELAPALCEALVLGRDVELVSLAGGETTELNRALAVVENTVGFELPRLGVDGERSSNVSHLWMTSVLTDPESFPALHDELYRRSGDAATGRGSARAERRAAGELVSGLVEELAPPCVVTTTDEERPFFEHALAERGWELAVPENARLSAVVGDAVRLCRVRAW